MITAAAQQGSWLGAWFLGLVQGLTEFLPVSSSGHLVLFQQYIPVATDHVLFDLVLHLGTLLPVLYFYRRDVFDIVASPIRGEGPVLKRPGVKLGAFLVLATLPTGIIGVLLKDTFDQLFSTPAVLIVTFAMTGTLLFASRKLDGDKGLPDMLWWHALVLGLAQGFAITPGISRSGTTIVVALLLGFSPAFAARFSFLMSVPAILGAVVLSLRDADLAALDLPAMAIGGGTALVSGYAALVLLVFIVKRRRLSSFAWYCWAMAFVAAGLAAYEAWG